MHKSPIIIPRNIKARLIGLLLLGLSDNRFDPPVAFLATNSLWWFFLTLPTISFVNEN